MNISFNLSGIPSNIQYVDVDSNLTDKEFREKYLTSRLSTKEKMDFYHSVINNDLESFKSFIYGTPTRPPYDIFEEVSQKGYGWTPFHYAMHYGKIDMIKFIIAYLYSQNKVFIAFKLKSNDGRCPLLCLLKSRNLSPQARLDVFNKIVTTFSIPLSKEVEKQLEVIKKRANENIVSSSQIQNQSQAMPNYPPNYAPNYPPNYAPNYPPNNAPNYPPSYAPNYPPSYVPNCPPNYAPNYPPNNAPNYPPNYAPNYPASPAPNNNVYISNVLTTDEKMELYNSVIKNNLELFKSLIYGSPYKKPYPMFEEVSAKNYYWTPLHYAMHYAKWDIIQFIFEYLFQYNLVNSALSLKTKESKCPLLCLLKSNALSDKVKIDTLDRLISTFPIPISNEVKDEIIKRKYDTLIQKIIRPGC